MDEGDGEGERGVRMSEEEISMVLNTFMYIDYKEADDGMTLNEILSELSRHPDCAEGGIHFGEYTVLRQAAQDPQIGNLVIDNQSCLMGCDSGTAACTFSSRDGGSIYVVYRGTGDGEWPDNGLGMTQKSTRQQERALEYFDRVVERNQISPSQRVIVTGHSKGGNKAQYVTMSTQYGELVDACYNIDGQGFSQKAIDGWKEAYGESGFEKRRRRITGIFGENDYVNVLGNSIVPKNQIFYVKTPVQVQNFAGYHDIKYMFASRVLNESTGEYDTVFGGRKNDYVMGQGKLGSYAAVLSGLLMRMEPERRDGCAATLMQLMELGGERKTGLNGERLTLSDIGDFVSAGIPVVADSVFYTGQGREMLAAAFCRKSFSQDMKGCLIVKAGYSKMAAQIEPLRNLALEVRKRKEEAQSVSERLPNFAKNSWLLCRSLKREAENLEGEAASLQELSEVLEKIIKIYMETDVRTAETW